MTPDAVASIGYPSLSSAASGRRPAAPGAAAPQPRSWGVVAADPVPLFADVFRGLMQLHGELVAEKDQTLELTKSLMARHQEVAELQSYVRLLETRLEEAARARRSDVEGWR